MTATVISGNRSLRIEVPPYGTMIFQLFDGRVRRVTQLDQGALAANGLPVPVTAPLGLQYAVDFDTGLMTIFPTSALTGRQRLTVATGVSPDSIDYQVVTVVIGTPNP